MTEREKAQPTRADAASEPGTKSAVDSNSGTGMGPGNRVIVTTLLESLAVRGQTAAHDRALLSLALSPAELANGSTWLSGDPLASMMLAADIDACLARSVGHRLIAPDATGLALYGLGLATPEKAYRRAQALLPRECPEATWTVEEIGSGNARLSFRDRDADLEGLQESPNSRESKSPRAQAALCGLRRGMLEAIPSLYGLLPAQVEETDCQARGAAACRYEIHWSRSTQSGLIVGSTLGLGIGIATLGVCAYSGSAWVSMTGAAAIASAVFLLGAIAGRCRDLQRQLLAVAGARRGHLALFDQVDDALALKLDALARVDAKLEGDEFAYRPDRLRLGSHGEAASGTAQRSELLRAAQKIHAATGDLACWFDVYLKSAHTDDQGDVEAPRGSLGEIRDRAEQLALALGSNDGVAGEAMDIGSLLTRAIAASRSRLPAGVIIDFDSPEETLAIECEPVQIEQVVIALLRNAASASQRLSESPEIRVTLARVGGGIEFAVEDRGVGIDPSEIDEVFDPFFEERQLGVDQGFGLPICLRIVERHGGELRIEVEDRAGTRVSVFLPDTQKSKK